ncbi:DUF2167 domain-containing protein [Sphingosinicella sp. BN140058]|uniref:DUF2167 domain-containing protein n=1 Tax=Sphingosinicella sp. BN140058 TaxID=1892855 RepID=UPI0010134EF7|nr:DUF2167 domain-containing protein [Sphingosinicella sp. BN140058]QAY79565.1 DUF2167 domain-containing protein [Sphingosinicella sp. BN140058]
MAKLKLILALCASIAVAPVQAQAPSNEQQAAMRQAEALMRDLHPVTGDVRIPEASAGLHLGKDYYFLPAEEARRVLVEGWGNPPETANGVLGMVFPAGKTFADDVWGAVITFEPTGWVSDDDAKSTDYQELVEQMQSGEEELNAERTKQGYPAQHLVGWAQQPAYDVRTHSVVWAQNIQFAGAERNTLNYDVRLLGRNGVLSLNMVTSMDKLAETRTAAAKFAQAAAFDTGARYADYKPGIDKKAEFGVGGLVAAGVGVAAAKKLGLLGIILAFGKKFIVLLLAGGAAIAGAVRRLFGGRKAEDEGYASDYGSGSAAFEDTPAETAAEPTPDRTAP